MSLSLLLLLATLVVPLIDLTSSQRTVAIEQLAQAAKLVIENYKRGKYDDFVINNEKWNNETLRGGKDADVGKDMFQIVAGKGYPIEHHFVTTQDRYILGVFRIPYGRNEKSNAMKHISKPIVFLQHGLMDSSYTFVNNFPSESLGFILADAGYDVWLGNNRGNSFSKQHEVYKTDSKEFWAFSWDEMARYDVPDMIEYVLNYTNQTKLAYVGHSEGTIQMFAMPSTIRKDVQNKVVLYGSLAGIAYVHHSKSPIFDLLAYLDVEAVFELFGFRQFDPGYMLRKLAPHLCNAIPRMCNLILELFCGPSHDLNNTRIQVYVSQTPTDTSVQNMAHWAQSITHEEFEKFNWGSDQENEKHYGQKTPPQYFLSNVTMPTVLYSATNDWLANPKDHKTLMEQLPKATIIDHVNIDNDFAHLDFVWGLHAHTLIYADLLEKIKKYLGAGKIVG